ncbi:RNA polymerase II associated factor 1 [Trichuris trichiura]|uniref:RNA polymerase II-associated factor 1 homolog n=1 Tax=Trichuris trichiura TaxID=36087 RepID=A0A077ZE70_TRITR|nr:RNA polymerase II associated factor 1 [Trichuris trichiura]
MESLRNGNNYSRNAGENASEHFVWPVKFGNTLPDVPFEAKFLPIPRNLNRYVGYKITNLERSFKYDVITDKDPPVLIDLVTLNSTPNDQKTEEGISDIDVQLLEDDCGTHRDRKRFNQKLHDIVSEVNQYQSKESQLAAIEKKFSEVRSIPRKHPCKASVFAVEVGGLFYLTFLVTSSISRGMMDENNEQFVAYLLPSNDALQRIKAGSLRMEYNKSKNKRFDYEFARQYNWHLRSKACTDYEANYCLTIRNGCAYYNELDTSVRLNRCALNKQNSKLSDLRVMVTFRQPNDQEIAAQEARMRILQLASDEDTELKQNDSCEPVEEESPKECNSDVSYEWGKDDNENEPVNYMNNTLHATEKESSPDPSCSWE